MGGKVLGLFIVARYDPGPTLGQIVVTPWVCAQVARCDLGVRLRHGVPLGCHRTVNHTMLESKHLS